MRNCIQIARCIVETLRPKGLIFPRLHDFICKHWQLSVSVSDMHVFVEGGVSRIERHVDPSPALCSSIALALGTLDVRCGYVNMCSV